MLNFSPEKLLLVGIIALMVLGPHRLPNAARSLARFLAAMRRMSSSWQSEVRDTLAEPRDMLTGAMSETGLADLRRSLHDGVSEVRNGISGTVLGDKTGQPAEDRSPAAAPTPASDPARDVPIEPAPEDPSLN